MGLGRKPTGGGGGGGAEVDDMPRPRLRPFALDIECGGMVNSGTVLVTDVRRKGDGVVEVAEEAVDERRDRAVALPPLANPPEPKLLQKLS